MTMAEYIERKALDKALTAAAAHDKDKNRRTWAKAICILHDLPAADVAPVVHARWIEKSAPARKIYFECSHCGAQENKHTAIKGYYCWRCGARMDGDSDAFD